LAFDTTHDAFLSGRLTLEQPRVGYRAGVDPVLLAASVPAVSGQSVLDLGSGVGAAMLCLAARVPDLDLNAVEIQPAYADLCQSNAQVNWFTAQVWTADLRALPDDLRARTFDHVITNPPYFDRTHGNASEDVGRDMAFAGDTRMTDWIDTATRRLKPKGWLTLIQKADRLGDVLGAMDARLGSVSIVPMTGRMGRDADRIILRARKGGRAPLRLHAPVHLHDGATHDRDAEDYAPAISAVLRHGAKFPFPD
jgi:tRNA1(Val) A37 N6-methylase TrmN6